MRFRMPATSTGSIDDPTDSHVRARAANSAAAEAHNSLASMYLEREQFENAEAALQSALSLEPAFTDALDNLGVLRALSGRHDEALRLYELALSHDPSHVQLHVHRAAALIALGRQAEARAAAECAIALAPRDPGGYNVLGLVFSALENLAAAEACYGAAIAVDPMHADALGNLGEVLIKRGDIDWALRCFQRALELEPENGTHHLRLVHARLGTTDAAHVAQMERLAQGDTFMRSAARIDLHFALASAYEHINEHGKAFRSLSSANTLKRARIDYDEAARMRFFASLEHAFSEEFIAAFRGCGHPSQRPIFIFGMPRSGSTLVEQLLAAIPDVAAAGEVDVFDSAIGTRLMKPGMRLADLRDGIAAVGNDYVRATDRIAGRATRVTDKMLHNFCYAPLIHLALPNARMIHIRRDPLDTCFSCYATNFLAGGLSYAYDLGELGRYYAAYHRLMEQWRARLPPECLLEVDYESLVDDFETQARRIVDFCGLRWDPRALAFHTVRRTVRTASSVQVRRPLYRSAVGRSGRYADALTPLIEALDGLGGHNEAVR